MATGVVELVVLEPRHQAIDDLHRVLQIGVEQDDRQLALGRSATSRSVSRTSRLTSRAISRSTSACGTRSASRRRRLDEHERQEVLRAHGALQLVVEHEVERFGRQHAEVLSRNGSPAITRPCPVRFLDLVEQRLVADAEDLRRFAAVPARLLQRAEDQLALRFARGRAARCPSAIRSAPRGALGGAAGAGAAAAPAARRDRRGRRRSARCSAGIGPDRSVAAGDRVGELAADRVVGAENDHPLDQVLELAHVARPVVFGEQPQRVGGQRDAAACCSARQYCVRKSSVSAGISSRRWRSGGSVMQTTLRRKNRSSRNCPSATATSRSRLVAATMRTSTRTSLRAAEPRELAVLQHLQQLRLQRQLHLADLVEEHRAVVGELELARLVLDGAGERAALEPEQLRLEQLGRQRRAVDLDERLVAARRRAVDARARPAPCRCRSRRGSAR